MYIDTCESGLAKMADKGEKARVASTLAPTVRGAHGGRFGLNGLDGLGTVWERFTKCGFWGEKGRKIGLNGLERFTAGRRVNRFGQGVGVVRPALFAFARLCPPFYGGVGRTAFG